MSLTAVIIDDEPLARAYLRSLLEEQGVGVLGEADNVAAGLQRVEDLHPDVAFLDVDMPGLTGLQMAQAMAPMEHAPLIVFVTGYSHYAVDAFEQGAIDYLVKPVAADRLATTLGRVRSRLAESASPALDSPATQPAPEKSAAQPLSRLPVRVDYAVKLLRVEEIVVAAAREKRVFVQTTDGAESRTYYTLTQLEEMLPADKFARIHDSYIVNMNSIEELVYLGSHAYEVKLAGGAMLPVGRRRFGELKRRLGLRDG